MQTFQQLVRRIAMRRTSFFLSNTLARRNYSFLRSATQLANDRRPNIWQNAAAGRLPVRLASTAVGAAEPSSALAGLWQTLSNSTPVAYMQEGLTEIHEYTGLPWWSTIILSTIVFRSLVTLPLTIYQHKITARIEQITLEMPALVAELKKEAAVAMKHYKWTEKHTRLVYNRSLKNQWNKLVVRENCHPAKTLIVIWGQIPLWICQSVALRNLVHMLPDPVALQAQIIFTELTIGGFGWIPNLTEVDSSFIMPVALGIINLSIIELQSMLRTRPSTRMQTIATNAFRVVSVVMIPVACSVPSALCLYWVASSSYGLAQNLFLISPTVRRAVGIPKTKSEFINPYEHIWTTIKLRTGQMTAKSAAVEVNSNEQQAIESEHDATKSKKRKSN